MMSRSPFLPIVAVIGGLLCLPIEGRSQSSNSGVSNATVRVAGKDGTGAGVVVHVDAKTALVLTAQHVVEGSSGVEVFFRGALTPLKAEVAKSTPDRDDLALLLVHRDGTTLPNEPPVLSYGTNAVDGEQVYAVGHAGDVRWIPSAAAAVVQSTDSENTSRFRFANVGVDQGFSGGPVMASNDGRIVGIFVAMTRTHGIAVKFDRVLEIVQNQWGVQTLNRLVSVKAPPPSTGSASGGGRPQPFPSPGPGSIAGIWSGTLTFGTRTPISLELSHDANVTLKSPRGDVASGRWSLSANTVRIDARHRELGAFTCELTATAGSIKGPCEALGKPAGIIDLSNRRELPRP